MRVCIFVVLAESEMNECYGNKFILNGSLHPADLFDNSMVYEGDSIYEVIRLKNGIPLFFPDHMERLSMSVTLQKKEFPVDVASIRKAVILVARTSRKKESNLKVVLNYKKGIANYLIYLIESVYPTNDQYKKGVKGILFYAERKDPEAKVINHKLRSEISHRLIHEGGYEAILVNEKNEITEGSRSNIFFIRHGSLITAPDNVVLNGVTRKYLLRICRENEIAVRFECIKTDHINKFDAVFMSGTSPMVLPFCSISNIPFNVKDPLIERLRKLYLLHAEKSMAQFRSQ